MNDDTRAVLEAAILKDLTDRNKTTRSTVQGSLRPGDRRTVWLDNDTELGTVRLDRPSTGWKITDREAFTAWVERNHPAAVITRTEVVPAWEAEFLKDPVAADTGEIPPGVEEATSTPRLVVTPNDQARVVAQSIFGPGLKELEP